MRRMAIGVAAVAIAALVGDVLSQGTTTGVFRYPVWDGKTGRKTAEIRGDSAADAPGGGIRIERPQLALYSSDGTTNALVTAVDCVYKLEDQSAVSDSDVRIESGGIVITGRGFRCQVGSHAVRIMSHVRVEFGGSADLGAYIAPPGG